MSVARQRSIRPVGHHVCSPNTARPHNSFPFSSGGEKSDFGGHDNHQYRNVYINRGGCMGVCAQLEGHEDQFCETESPATILSLNCWSIPDSIQRIADNNTCIMTVVGESYASFQTAANSGGVAKPAMPVMHDNRVYTPDGASTSAFC